MGFNNEIEERTDELLVRSLDLKKLAISADNIYKEPPFLMRIKNIGMFPRGDFSVIVGPQKSRKSFLATLFCEVFLMHDYSYFHSTEENIRVAYVDTEQADYYVSLIYERLQKYAKNEDIFKVYPLREYLPMQRLLIIDRIIKEVPCDIMIIDGIRDLVTSINDENQATFVVSKLLQWTKKADMHISLIIHENKADKNARGHIGSEAQNKSQTVISVMENLENEHISDIRNKYSRAPKFEDFSLEIVDGMPQVVGQDIEIPF